MNRYRAVEISERKKDWSSHLHEIESHSSMIQAVTKTSDSNTTDNITKRFHLPAAVFRKRYRYDPETGAFFSRRTGKAIGAKSSGSLRIEIKRDGVRHVYLVHRIAVYMQTGIDPVGCLVRHIDGNNQNNAFANLKLEKIGQGDNAIEPHEFLRKETNNETTASRLVLVTKGKANQQN